MKRPKILQPQNLQLQTQNHVQHEQNNHHQLNNHQQNYYQQHQLYQNNHSATSTITTTTQQRHSVVSAEKTILISADRSFLKRRGGRSESNNIKTFTNSIVEENNKYGYESSSGTEEDECSEYVSKSSSNNVKSSHSNDDSIVPFASWISEKRFALLSSSTRVSNKLWSIQRYWMSKLSYLGRSICNFLVFVTSPVYWFIVNCFVAEKWLLSSPPKRRVSAYELSEEDEDYGGGYLTPTGPPPSSLLRITYRSCEKYKSLQNNAVPVLERWIENTTKCLLIFLRWLLFLGGLLSLIFLLALLVPFLYGLFNSYAPYALVPFSSLKTSLENRWNSESAHNLESSESVHFNPPPPPPESITVTKIETQTLPPETIRVTTVQTQPPETVVVTKIEAPPPPPEPLVITKIEKEPPQIFYVENRDRRMQDELIRINARIKHLEAVLSKCDCKPQILNQVGGGLPLEEVERLVREAIAKYDADKTGLPDLALESSGGSVIGTKCTKFSPRRNSMLSIFGFNIWSMPNNPRVVIQPGAVPGECWAFEGSVGDIVLKLIGPSILTGFTLEHIPKSISPYENIDSAPYKFQVLGLQSEDDVDSVWDFGTYSYEDNGEAIQYFQVQNPVDVPYPIVHLKILSNHGNLEFTCLYRFRVHGQTTLF